MYVILPLFIQLDSVDDGGVAVDVFDDTSDEVRKRQIFLCFGSDHEKRSKQRKTKVCLALLPGSHSGLLVFRRTTLPPYAAITP